MDDKKKLKLAQKYMRDHPVNLRRKLTPQYSMIDGKQINKDQKLFGRIVDLDDVLTEYYTENFINYEL